MILVIGGSARSNAKTLDQYLMMLVFVWIKSLESLITDWFS
jgi:hypothetical protein